MPQLPPLNAFSESVLLLVSIILIKIILKQYVRYEPLDAYRFYCDKLQAKVNRNNSTSSQQTISGLIAMVITLFPLVTILGLFEIFISVNWLWQGMLLYLAMGTFGLKTTTINIAKTLAANQNGVARKTIQSLVLRETAQLNTMGISKTCIEMYALRTMQQGFIVSFYFIIAGPLAALTYRLLLEMHYSWNIKQSRFTFFGLRCHQLLNLTQWLPSRLFSFILILSALGKNAFFCWRLTHKQFFQLGNHLLIHCLALSLNIRLGGVAIYNGNKSRTNYFNDQAKQPDPCDIIYATKRIQQIITACIVGLIFTAILTQSLSL